MKTKNPIPTTVLNLPPLPAFFLQHSCQSQWVYHIRESKLCMELCKQAGVLVFFHKVPEALSETVLETSGITAQTCHTILLAAPNKYTK